MKHFLKAYYDKHVLSVLALIVFQFFVSYLNENIKLILPVTRSKDPKAARFDTENVYRKPPLIQ
jgi:hypothetical protein